MNVELYSYTLFATVLGMLVVFLSLTALSVMMVALKRVFSRKEGPEGARAPGVRKSRAGAGESPAGEQLPLWVPAAVAAYLAEEQPPDRPTADPWNAVVNQYDPWISGDRFGKRGV